MLEAARDGVDALLIAPTGGGKTLGGFLPSLVELAGGAAGKGLHTLYISPLKALATDIAPQPGGAGGGDGPRRSATRRAPATRRRTAASASAATRRTSC